MEASTTLKKPTCKSLITFIIKGDLNLIVLLKFKTLSLDITVKLIEPENRVFSYLKVIKYANFQK